MLSRLSHPGTPVITISLPPIHLSLINSSFSKLLAFQFPCSRLFLNHYVCSLNCYTKLPITIQPYISFPLSSTDQLWKNFLNHRFAFFVPQLKASYSLLSKFSCYILPFETPIYESYRSPGIVSSYISSYFL